jgi:membrane associated rhomboid family serine protease
MKQQPVQMNFPLTPTVKWLMIVNVSIWFFLQLLVEGYGNIQLTKFFALYPGKFIYDFFLWQPITYMFLHSMQVFHVVLNMVMLWFVGGDLELRWGRKFFLMYYLWCGVGAALIYCLGVGIYSAVTGSQHPLVVPVVGASGAIFGLLLAYGILFGERMMYFMMLIPMKAKYFVLALGAFEFASLLSAGINGGEVAYLAHLGGLVSGYVGLLSWTRFQQRQFRSANKKKGTGKLRLVVDNEKTSSEDKDPKYWN